MRFDTPTADELPLVYDAWARSFRKSPWAGCVLNKDWDSVSRNTIGEILDRGARVVVAVQDLTNSDGVVDARRVMGYSVSEPREAVLHWLYVKDTYRRLGIGRALLAETLRSFEPEVPSWEYTHRTPSSERFFRACGHHLTHNPVPARVKR